MFETKDVANTYNRLASEWNKKGVLLTKTNGESDRLIELVIKNLSDANSLLDVGCGSGKVGKHVRRSGCECSIEMIDPSEKMAKIAREYFRNDENATVSIGDVEDAARAGGKFDVISALHVLHHLADPGKALRLIRSMLEDDGVFIALSLGDELHKEIFGREEGAGAPRMFGRRTGGDWRRLFDENGLRVQVLIEDFFTFNFLTAENFVDHLESIGLLARGVEYSEDDDRMKKLKEQIMKRCPNEPLQTTGHHITIVARA